MEKQGAGLGSGGAGCWVRVWRSRVLGKGVEKQGAGLFVCFCMLVCAPIRGGCDVTVAVR